MSSSTPQKKHVIIFSLQNRQSKCLREIKTLKNIFMRSLKGTLLRINVFQMVEEGHFVKNTFFSLKYEF